MKLNPVLKGVAQTVALALVVTSLPLAKNEAPKAASIDPPAANGPPVARLVRMEGNVLVSQESGLAAVEENSLVGEGSRVITTANSIVVVSYVDGCEVELKSNQRLEISLKKPCPERTVQAHSIFLEPAGMALAGGAGAGGGAAAAALAGGLPGVFVGGGLAGAAGLAKLASARDTGNVSPN